MKIIYPKRAGKKSRPEFKDGNFDRIFKAAFHKWHMEKIGTPYVEWTKQHQP